MKVTELIDDINNCLLSHEYYGEVWIEAIERRLDKLNVDIQTVTWHELIDIVNRSILYWVGTHSSVNALYKEANSVLVTPERRKYINFYLEDLKEFASKSLLTTENEHVNIG